MLPLIFHIVILLSALLSLNSFPTRARADTPDVRTQGPCPNLIRSLLLDDTPDSGAHHLSHLGGHPAKPSEAGMKRLMRDLFAPKSDRDAFKKASEKHFTAIFAARRNMKTLSRLNERAEELLSLASKILESEGVKFRPWEVNGNKGLLIIPDGTTNAPLNRFAESMQRRFGRPDQKFLVIYSPFQNLKSGSLASYNPNFNTLYLSDSSILAASAAVPEVTHEIVHAFTHSPFAGKSGHLREPGLALVRTGSPLDATSSYGRLVSFDEPAAQRQGIHQLLRELQRTLNLRKGLNPHLVKAQFQKNRAQVMGGRIASQMALSFLDYADYPLDYLTRSPNRVNKILILGQSTSTRTGLRYFSLQLRAPERSHPISWFIFETAEEGAEGRLIDLYLPLQARPNHPSEWVELTKLAQEERVKMIESYLKAFQGAERELDHAINILEKHGTELTEEVLHQIQKHLQRAIDQTSKAAIRKN